MPKHDKNTFGAGAVNPHSFFDSDRSYKNFKEHNEVKFFSKNPYTDTATIHTKLALPAVKMSNSLINGAKHGMIDMGIHSIDHHIPGLGKQYLAPHINAVMGVMDASHRIMHPIIPTDSKAQKVVCGVLGAGTKTTVSVVGTGAVLTSAAGIVGATDGLATYAAIPYALAGLSLVDQLSQSTGDATELVCHKSFQAIRKLDEILSTPSPRP